MIGALKSLNTLNQLNDAKARLDVLEKRLQDFALLTKENNDFIYKLKIESDYKRGVSDSIAKWMRIVIVVLPILFGFATYLSYEFGLNTPQPVKKN